MKYCIEKYPIGSIKGQRTPGRYMSEYLHNNLKILAESIVNDMTFLGILFSSTLEVGTGKSVLAQQIGEAWVEQVNKLHGLNLTFTTKNIVFRPKDLIERAFKLPQYSIIILDEWEDAHYWSELGMSLRQFFRKCRQLNLFMLIIIPNFFQLSPAYAISRSVFAIDVKFKEKSNFERGTFDFYNFNKKKELYILGKRHYNYGAVSRNFPGTFLDGYTVGDKEYRDAKYQDMVRAEDDRKDKPVDEKQVMRKVLGKLRKNMPYITLNQWAEGFGLGISTIKRWLVVDREEIGVVLENISPKVHNN